MRYFWFALGTISLVLGVVGIFLPLLPTVPFFLLAAFGFGKSSKRAHNWLISHPNFGPAILDWQDRGAISRRSKLLSAGSMLAVVGLAFLFGAPTYIVIIQIVVLSVVSFFIWTRPDQ